MCKMYTSVAAQSATYHTTPLGEKRKKEENWLFSFKDYFIKKHQKLYIITA